MKKIFLILSILFVLSGCGIFERSHARNIKYLNDMFPDCVYFVDEGHNLYIVLCENRTIECGIDIIGGIHSCNVVKKIKK